MDSRNFTFPALAGIAAIGVISLGGCSSGNNSSSTPSGSPKELMNKGLAALNKNDLTTAKADFEAVIKNNPSNQGSLNTYAWYNLGIIATAQNNNAAAIQNYKNAVLLTPTYNPALFNLAIVETNAGKTKDAIAHYQQILVNKPDDANTLFNLGLLQYKSGNTTDGVKNINHAIFIDPALASRVPAGISLK